MLTIAQIEQSLPLHPLQTVDGLPLKKLATGKVREIFDAGDGRLLIVATDRLSAFDVILPDGIPGKGVLLTQLSLWWFVQTRGIVANHLVPDHDAQVAALLPEHPHLHARSMLVQKLEPLPLEAVVRGYLAGSGFKEYRRTGSLWDHPLPEGLRDAEKLPEPLFTPTTKAQAGHDEPVTAVQARAIVGAETFETVRQFSLALYEKGTQEAEARGILLADTKFEFGKDAAGKIILMDEALTPDSSRYWPAQAHQPGQAPDSFDKQIVRSYLETLDWNKQAPGPKLPPELIERTRQRYFELLRTFMV